MKIKIPSAVMRHADRFSDWANVEVWRRGRAELRRLDVFVITFFFVCVSWYWFTSGWMGALQGGALYIALAALALFVF